MCGRGGRCVCMKCVVCEVCGRGVRCVGEEGGVCV